MGKFKSSLLRLIPIISFVLFSLFTNGQNQLNGLWKSIYVTSYTTADTGIQYTRILLDIEDSVVTLKNFDGIFKEKQIFTNSGKIDQKNKLTRRLGGQRNPPLGGFLAYLGRIIR